MRWMIATAALLAAPVLHAEQVGSLGDPAKFEFVGLEAFRPSDIVASLRCDLEYQAASRPSADLDALLREVERLVGEGYRRRGYRPQVAAECVKTRVVVTIAEGPQVFGGAPVIECDEENVDPQLVDRLKSLLIRPEVKRAWVYEYGNGKSRIGDTVNLLMCPREPFRMDSGGALLAEHVAGCFFDLGYPDAHYSIGGLAELEGHAIGFVLRVHDFGPQFHVKEFIELSSKRPLNADLIQLLGLQPGQLLDQDALEAAEARLQSSGTVLAHRAVIALPPAAKQTPPISTGAILAYEAAKGPDGRHERSEQDRMDAAALRAQRWIERGLPEFDGDLEFSYRYQPPDAEPPLVVEGHLGVGRGMVAHLSGDNPTGLARSERLSVWLTWDKERLEIGGEGAPRRLSIRPNFGVWGSFEFWNQLNPGGTPEPCFSIASRYSQVGLVHRPLAGCVRLTPQAALLAARWPTSSVSGDTLSLGDPEGAVVKFNESTGAFVSWGMISDLHQAQVRACQRGEFDEQWRQAREAMGDEVHHGESADPKEAVMHEVVDIAFRQTEAAEELHHLIRAAAAAWESPVLADAGALDQGNPGIDGERGVQDQGNLFFGLNELLFERTSPPATLLREALICGLADQSTYDLEGAKRELERIVCDERIGPVLLSTMVGLFGIHDVLPMSAAAKLNELLDSPEAFERELDPWTEGDHLAPIVLRAMVAVGPHLSPDARDEICNQADKSLAPWLEALLDRRNECPDESLDDCVEGALLSVWHDRCDSVAHAAVKASFAPPVVDMVYPSTATPDEFSPLGERNSFDDKSHPQPATEPLDYFAQPYAPDDAPPPIELSKNRYGE